MGNMPGIKRRIASKRRSVESSPDSGSDSGICDSAATFCKAALKGASLNVYINTKSMADREYAEELNAKADAMLEKYCKLADETFDSVLARLK